MRGSRRFSIAFILASILPFLTISSAASTKVRPHFVLVPGFFNSLAPVSGDEHEAHPYFSSEIVETLKQFGDVSVIDDLQPFGSIAANGEILEQDLQSLVNRSRTPLTIIAHSAGGFYVMHALTRNPHFPIDAVVTIATPYDGIEFIDHLTDTIPGINQLARFLNLESLREFRSDNTRNALASMALPAGLKWIAIAGTQKPCFLIQCADSRYLSWVLNIPHFLMSQPSDGIVTRSSALATGARLRNSKGEVVQIETWPGFDFELEHWEMVEDASIFSLLGIVNTGHIRDRQRDVFAEIAGRILSGHR